MPVAPRVLVSIYRCNIVPFMSLNKVLADSINISSIYAGIEDGVKMPPECLTACN